MPSSSAKLQNGSQMTVFSQHNTIFLSIIITEDQPYYPALLNNLISVLNHLSTRSSIGKLVISRDFEVYSKNMGYLIIVDPFHKIFYCKKIDPLPTKSATEEIQLLMEHQTDYILP